MCCCFGGLSRETGSGDVWVQPQDDFALGWKVFHFYLVFRAKKELLLWKNKVLVHWSLKKPQLV